MEKVTNSLQISVPQSFVDEGDGVVSFPNGLTITDGSVQRNGTKYDIDSLDTTKYGNTLTGDHEDKLSSLIGEVIGVVKQDGKVVVNKIRYAVKENAYAKLAYDLLVGGFSKNFSTETIGPKPGHDGVWWNSELVGLSQVVTQNNYNAHINAVVHNSLEQAKQDGLDVENNKVLQDTVHAIEEDVKNHVEDEHKMEEDKNKKAEVEAKEAETKATEVAQAEAETTEEKKAPVEEETKEVEKETTEKETDTEETKNNTETEEKEEATKTESETDKEEVKEEVKTEVSEEKETNKKDEKMDEDKKVETQNSSLTAEAVAEIVANALKPLNDKVSSLETDAKNAFDKSAKEPEFKKGEEKEVAKNKFEAMSSDERYQAQVDAAWNYVKLGNIEAGETLREINKLNLEGLKKAGIAKNAITLDDLGNFVIPEEMYREIAGHRNDYSALINVTEWRETLSLEFAWLERVGDIDMQNVAIGVDLDGTGVDGDDDDRLKPVSEYSAVPRKSALEELAAVTVVANSATRFAAVDLLADAAQGYRTDYDRKRAQLVVARLEQAIDSTGYSVAYNPSEDVDALTAWLDAVTAISDTTLTGTLVFNARTFAELKSRALKAGANGPLSEILTTGDLPTVFGYRFIVVPNDLMPSLGGSETIAHTVDGVSVPINHAVYFAELSTFTGRTSGGLQYDVSNSASYETGGVVKSAYQRNELVLRGSFFRGGAVKDKEVVSGVRQGSGANVS